MRRLVRALLVVGLSLPGCGRKAPSPDECVAFTEMLFGLPHEAVLQSPRAKAQFDALVVACLTEPFDQRVFSCTKESRSPLVCLQRFEPELLTTKDELVSGPRRKR